MHVPVLVAEVVELLRPAAGETYVDCTAGLGGHAAAMAERGVAVVLNDSDAGNLARAGERAPGARVFRGNFAELPHTLAAAGIRADMVLADLGFSSNQIQDGARGLSFMADGPLDMRLDTSRGATAAELVGSLPEAELARIIDEFGDERQARRVARKLVQARGEGPISTTGRLAELVRSVVPRSGGIDPATRTFQALRIAVNDELGSLEALLAAVGRDAAAVLRGKDGSWLRAGARVGIISFHSLEDRAVKRAFAEMIAAGADDVSGGAVTAGEAEVGANPRSRSAKLRVVRLGMGAAGR